MHFKKIKIQYTKGEEIKFISNLDMMRVLERAIRRAEIPIVYSQGFNPRMKISYSPAIKVGQTSNDLYAILRIDGNIKPFEVQERLNKELPVGMKVISAYLC